MESIKDEIELAAADTETLRRQPDPSDDEPEVERASAVVNDQVCDHTQLNMRPIATVSIDSESYASVCACELGL